MQQHRLYEIPLRQVEDEFVAQNCYRLNQAFYASLGEKQAFVLSQGRNLMILKIVGFAEEAALYYQLLDSGPTSGSPTSAIPPRAASGTPAAPTPSRR